MKNYEEKQKKLENVLSKLDTMSDRVIKMNNIIDSLNLEKNQLLREKEISEKNFKELSKQHSQLKADLEKADRDVNHNFGNQENFKKKIDELNQETETLIDEIEKWQT